MVKLFTDAETALGCSNWRPIPLYLQEPILAVPKFSRYRSIGGRGVYGTS